MSLTLFSRRFRRQLRREEDKQGRQLTLKEFVAVANPHYKWFWHHEAIAAALHALDEGSILNPLTGKPIKRGMFMIPPRHGKSELISKLYSAYRVYKNPRFWAAISSYSAELAYTFSKAARSYFVGNGGLLDRAMRAVKQWQTLEGGGLWAAGIRGTMTGKGCTWQSCDDPLKNAEEASSVRIREKVMDQYRSAWLTRQEVDFETGDEPIECLVQTRWHLEDPIGQLLEEERLECEIEDGEPDGWIIVDFPAIREHESERPEYPPSCYVWPDPRQPGEALWPEKYSVGKLNRIRKRIGEYFWAALYQGRPRPNEGSFFMVGQVEFQRSARPFLPRLVRFWDLAATEADGDYTVGVLMAGPDHHGKYYIFDVVRFRHEASKRNKLIRMTAELDGLMVKQVFPIDPGAAGKGEQVSLSQLLAGFDVEFQVVPRVSKDTVARPLASQFNAGNVVICSAVAKPWERDLIEEFRVFKGLKGDVDDIVDAAAGCFNKLAGVDPGGYAAGGKR